MSVVTISARTDVTATVTVRLTGAPDIKADYTDRMIRPHFAVIKYVYASPDGVGASVWTPRRVDVQGRHVLKSGDVGVGVHKAGWSVFIGRDVREFSTHNPLPGWLSKIVTDHLPVIG